MVITRPNANPIIVKWWDYTRWNSRFYFDLIRHYPPRASKQQMLELHMQLQQSYIRIHREDYPRAASNIRQLLLASMHDLIESLRYLIQDQGEQCQSHYDKACRTFTEMLYELMAHGISEKDLAR